MVWNEEWTDQEKATDKKNPTNKEKSVDSSEMPPQECDEEEVKQGK